MFELMRTTALALALAFCLAACGQSSSQAPSSPAPAARPAALTPEQIAAAMAALPAPYDQADYEAGRSAFGQCRSCHRVEAGAPSGSGPNLHGLIGRQAGSLATFPRYSEALQSAGFAWDAEHLDRWLENPRAYIPGSQMLFAGVRNENDRRNIIAYLMVATADAPAQ